MIAAAATSSATAAGRLAAPARAGRVCAPRARAAVVRCHAQPEGSSPLSSATAAIALSAVLLSSSVAPFAYAAPEVDLYDLLGSGSKGVVSVKKGEAPTTVTKAESKPVEATKLSPTKPAPAPKAEKKAEKPKAEKKAKEEKKAEKPKVAKVEKKSAPLTAGPVSKVAKPDVQLSVVPGKKGVIFVKPEKPTKILIDTETREQKKERIAKEKAAAAAAGTTAGFSFAFPSFSAPSIAPPTSAPSAPAASGGSDGAEAGLVLAAEVLFAGVAASTVGSLLGKK